MEEILDTTAEPINFATTENNGKHAHGIELADLGGGGGSRLSKGSS